MAGDNQITGEHVVIRRSLERGLLFLKARPREEVDELSAREFLVARLLASGLTASRWRPSFSVRLRPSAAR